MTEQDQEEKYYNKLFLIGNGFDIGHGLRTRYSDFMTWYLKECFKKAMISQNGRYEDDFITLVINKNVSNDSLESVFLETLNQKDLTAFLPDQSCTLDTRSGFIHLTQIRSQDYTCKIVQRNTFVLNILKNCFGADWSGIEDEIYRFLKKQLHALKNNGQGIVPSLKDRTGYISLTNTIISVNRSVTHLKKMLCEYLKTQNNPRVNKKYWIERLIDECPEIEDHTGIDHRPIAMFLNFNYTTHSNQNMVQWFRSRCANRFSDYDTNYIHGRIDDPNLDNIVFGVGDEANDFYEEVESECGDEWLQCMKSFNYFRNQNYQDLLGFIEGALPYDIYILGHSCSITDRTLLKMIFEHDNCNSINIFHYNGMDSYMKTAYNVARNFSDKVKMRKVVKPFDKYLSMD